MERWEHCEGYIDGLIVRNDGSLEFDFSSVEYAEESGIESWEASANIQAHLDESRKEVRYDRDGKEIEGSRPRTRHMLHRQPGTRTSTARWAPGYRAKDARALGAALSDDVRRKVVRAYQPDMRRLAERNPRARTFAEARIEAVVDNALNILDLAATGLDEREETPA